MKHSLRVLAWAFTVNTGLVGVATAGQYDTLNAQEMVQMRSQVREVAPEEWRGFQPEIGLMFSNEGIFLESRFSAAIAGRFFYNISR